MLNVFTIPIYLVVAGTSLILLIYDAFVPKKLLELIPLLEVNRTLLVQMNNFLIDPKRLEAMQAINNIDAINEKLDEIVEGYALRKGIGQSVDFALSGLALSVFGLAAVFKHSSNPTLLLYLFGTATMALSTFAGLFGPPYALFGASKDFSLTHGSYRSASTYKALESLMALPFISSSAGFLLLDMPPVDHVSLISFKSEIGAQMEEVQEKLNVVLGTDKSAVPKRTIKMVDELMEKSQNNLANLDFRDLRQEKARQFSLNYYQKEFSLIPWKRKAAVKEFARQHHFTLEEAENTLKLISYKIHYGQEDEDLINNVMVTGALKGIIMKEMEYSETHEDLELGQLSTGLAFGARQFMEDQYVLQTQQKKIVSLIRSISLFLFAAPIMLSLAFIEYCSLFYDYIVNQFRYATQIRIWQQQKDRYNEIKAQLLLVLPAIRSKLYYRKKAKQVGEKNSSLKGIWNFVIRVFKTIVDFVVLPFKILFKIFNWIIIKLKGGSLDNRQKLAEELSHAALVSMYNELYSRLVMQTNVSTAY